MAKITNAALLSLVDGKLSLVNAELAELKRRVDALSGEHAERINVIDTTEPLSDGYASKAEAVAAGCAAARMYHYNSCRVVQLQAGRWGYVLGK